MPTSSETSVIEMESVSEQTPEILVVDDEESITKMLKQLLEFEGYSIRIAMNGRSALDAVYERKPALIILDLMMPGMNGFEVCKELKTRREFSPIPIIMLTAKKDRADRITGLRIGANDYITKPFDINGLLSAIQDQLRKSRQRAEEEGVECHASFEIKSDFTYIKQVNELIMRMFKQTDLSEDEIMEFEYCLNEALMNAVEHGSKLDPTKTVFVSYTLKRDTLILEIEDEGLGFDSSTVPDPTTEENILNPRGRGIFIMNQYMDEVKYNDKGTKLTLIKNLKS